VRLCVALDPKRNFLDVRTILVTYRGERVSWRVDVRRVGRHVGDITPRRGSTISGSNLDRMRIIVLSVHYKYPDLLRDQWKRIRQCVDPTRQLLDAEVHYHPIVHGGSAADVVEVARAASAADGLLCSCIVLPDKPPTSASAHGDSLADAALGLMHGGEMHDEDLIAVMDHDAHPLSADLFAAVGQRLLSVPSLGGIGIPQWHRGHCFLHPSFLMARAELVRQIGPDAFRMRLPENGASLRDVGEGFTVWCENHGRAVQPLRVNATRLPWSRWDSDMVPNGGAELVGAHGERVRVGNLMHYGLGDERSLVSHVWAAPLKRQSTSARVKRWLTGRTPASAHDYDERRILSAYLSESTT
jgi:hypothetical protein